jgi:hypothetical protein
MVARVATPVWSCRIPTQPYSPAPTEALPISIGAAQSTPGSFMEIMLGRASAYSVVTVSIVAPVNVTAMAVTPSQLGMVRPVSGLAIPMAWSRTANKLSSLISPTLSSQGTELHTGPSPRSATYVKRETLHYL